MNKILIIILGSLCCAMVMAAGLDDIDQWGMVTIGNEDPYYILPKGFSPQDTTYKKSGIIYSQFFFKDGKNLTNWEQRIHLQAVLGKPDPAGNNLEVTKKLLMENVRKNCPDSFFQGHQLESSTDRTGFVIGCYSLKNEPNIGIVGYHILIEGRDSMFDISREARMPRFNQTPNPFGEMQTWKEHLLRTVICSKGEVCIRDNKSSLNDSFNSKALPKVTELGFKLGDTEEQVKLALHTIEDTKAFTSTGNSKNAYQLYISNEGIRVFFDKAKISTLVTLEKPFAGGYKNVKVGDNITKAEQTLGDDFKKSFKFGSYDTYFYRPIDGSVTRFDVNTFGNIEKIFILGMANSQ